MLYSRCLGVVLLSLAAAAAPAQRLYEFEEPPGSGIVVAASSDSIGPDVQVPWNLSVRVDLDLVRSAPGLLGFPLPGGETHWVARTGFEDRGDGNVLWTGSESASNYSTVLLRLHDGRLRGRFHVNRDEWIVIGSAANAVIRKRTIGDVPEESHSPTIFAPSDADEHHVHSHDPISIVSPSASDKPTQDMLVVYTAKALHYIDFSYWGSTVKEEVGYAVDEVNLVYANSNIDYKVRLVGVEEMPDGLGLADDGTWNLLAQTQNQELKDLRAKHNADIVYAYVFFDVPECGRAYARSYNQLHHDWAFVDYAHGFTNLYCDADPWYPGVSKWWTVPHTQTMPHELGHIHGALHDPASDGSPDNYAILPYAHGYVNETEGMRSVVVNHATASYMPYYSTTRMKPEPPYSWGGGVTLGKAGVSENDRVVRALSHRTTQLSEYLIPPAAPTGLTGTVSKVSGKYRVSLYWTDNARNEDAYVVRWGRTKKNKQVRSDPFDQSQTYRRSTDPNRSSALILNLDARKEYAFKVQAVNGYGTSESGTIRLKMK